MTRRLARYVALLAIGTLVVAFAAACSLIDDDDEPGSGNAGGARATGVVFRTDLGTLATRNLVPSTAREITVEIRLEGVSAGQRVTARWYQLGVADAGSEGKEISSRDVTLQAGDINEGMTFANFSISSQRFPEDAWLVRFYVNNALVRTSAFVITSAAGAIGAPANNAQPNAAATPTSYTIQANDTLTTIAQRFLPPGESLANFIGRIQTLNNLQNVQPTVPLAAGQTLRIPPAQ